MTEQSDERALVEAIQQTAEDLGILELLRENAEFLAALRKDNIGVGTRAELAAALAKAQGAFKKIEKNREVTVRSKKPGVPPYSFKYAELEKIYEGTRAALSENGLAVIHQIVDERLVTSLIHETGARISSSVTVGKPSSWQNFGAALTYARRYTTAGLLAVAAEDDLDAPQESAPPEAKKGAPAREPAADKPKPGWRFDEDSCEIELVEPYDDKKLAQKGFYVELRRAIKRNPRPGWAERVLDANRKKVEQLPKKPQTLLDELAQQCEDKWAAEMTGGMVPGAYKKFIGFLVKAIGEAETIEKIEHLEREYEKDSIGEPDPDILAAFEARRSFIEADREGTRDDGKS